MPFGCYDISFFIQPWNETHQARREVREINRKNYGHGRVNKFVLIFSILLTLKLVFGYYTIVHKSFFFLDIN